MRRFRRVRFGRTAAGVLASGVLIGGVACGPGPNDSTVFIDQVKAAPPGTLPWFCHSEGRGEDHVPENGHANPAYANMQKGDLSPEDCAKVAEFFDKAWASVRRFPTRGDAQKAGALQAVQFMPGVGTHDVLPGVNAPQIGTPDPAHPWYLQYDGNGPDAKLAGMSWYVVNFAGPPAGLAGDNDWWHTHTEICYSTVGWAIGNEISDEECALRGGRNMIWPFGWMVHAWIVPGYENHYDVFGGAFGCVKGTGPYAPPDDPCYLNHSDTGHPHVPLPAPVAQLLTNPSPAPG
jgi:hypothetical protein